MKYLSYNLFEDAVKRFGLTSTKLCNELGYSDSAWSEWKRTNKLPKVAVLAIEGLQRRQNQKRTAIVKATNLIIVDGGDVAMKEIHPGIWLLEV